MLCPLKSPHLLNSARQQDDGSHDDAKGHHQHMSCTQGHPNHSGSQGGLNGCMQDSGTQGDPGTQVILGLFPEVILPWQHLE